MHLGLLAALAAYVLWGVLPVYWKALGQVPPMELVAHRAFWSFSFLLLVLTWRRRWEWLRHVRKSRRTLFTFIATAGLLGSNWVVFLWAVSAGHIVDVSLGYFINPLINILLGWVFLHERLRPGQTAAIAIAVVGVVYLTLNYGAFPWVALTLACTFGLYALLRKTADLGAVEGLFFEMALLALPALPVLIYPHTLGETAPERMQMPIVVLLVLSGVVTAFPLMWFAYAARRVTLTTIGFLQYIAPTLHLLLGVVIFGESFTQTRLIGFSLIWLSLAAYSLEGALAYRKTTLVRSAVSR